MRSLLRTKNIDELIASAQDSRRHLERTLGPWSLAALGIGAVIGAGIFVLTGTAAAGEVRSVESILHAPLLDILREGADSVSKVGRPGAGPAVSLSFLVATIACALAGLCYAEFASMIPIAGSAYTYAYATLGEVVAWIIGWNLILEYAVSNMAVAVGFSAYLKDLIANVFGLQLPRVLSEPTIAAGEFSGAWFNLPAFLVIMLLTMILVRGVRESAKANNVMVVIKLTAILIFVGGTAHAVKTENWTPFMPNGVPGVLTGAAIVFFTFIGFDSVSTAAEECKRPQRDVPIGILASLIVCALLYVSVALVLTGVADWRTLNTASPVADVLRQLGLDRMRWIVGVGALVGMLSSLLVFQYGQARIWFAMSRDRLLPGVFSRVHPRFHTPDFATWIAGLAVGIPAGVWDVGTFADLSNIGTLCAFAMVSAGVIVLRRRQPERPRAFRVPWVPLVPLLSIASCLLLMASLPLETWVRFFVWLFIGLAIYWLYSRPRAAELWRDQ